MTNDKPTPETDPALAWLILDKANGLLGSNQLDEIESTPKDLREDIEFLSSDQGPVDPEGSVKTKDSTGPIKKSSESTFAENDESDVTLSNLVATNNSAVETAGSLKKKIAAGGLATTLAAGAFAAGVWLGTNGAEEESRQGQDSTAPTATDSDPNETDSNNNGQIFTEEQQEQISNLITLDTWRSQALEVRGPDGDERTHEATSSIVEGLLTKIAATRLAETEQEVELHSRVQVLSGAAYFVKRANDQRIYAVTDPIIQGMNFGEDGVMRFNQNARHSSNQTFMLFYYDQGSWEYFAVSEMDDARWFSNRGDSLVGVAYRADGPQIIQGNILQESLIDPASPMVVSLGGSGSVAFDGNLGSYANLEEIVEEIHRDSNYFPGELRDINWDIVNSR